LKNIENTYRETAKKRGEKKEEKRGQAKNIEKY